jgi:GT2 family glycosyltransferase
MKLFFLGYNAADYMSEWWDKENYKDVDFFFIDNGNQTLPNKIKDIHYYTTSKNVGCAGGWNLICDIAFNTMGLDKVIIGEEDARFDQDIIEYLWDNCTPNRLMTTYGNGFGFALFCIHKDTFNKIGRFDENFLYAAWEDADYKTRCKLEGVEDYCLEVDTSFNGSSTSFDPSSPRQGAWSYNRDHFYLKWGGELWNKGNYIVPFNGSKPYDFSPFLLQNYPNIIEFPSITEYKTFLNTI